MMRLGRVTGEIEHLCFGNLPSILRPGDMLVMNDTRVFKARVPAKKIPGGAAVEIFFLAPINDSHTWKALVRPGRKLPPKAKASANGIIIDIED